jgi:tRNA-splicing ligase RtcB (3'-phosphate/5'-hydroxy nucleic acid ligase)
MRITVMSSKHKVSRFVFTVFYIIFVLCEELEEWLHLIFFKMHSNITIFGAEIIDQQTIDQLKRCLIDETDIGVLTADAHYGYGHPIGGAVAYKNKISLSGVGFDIACGNKAVRTRLKANDVPIAKIMDEIFTQIGFGVGRPNPEPVDHPVLDQIAKAHFKPQRQMLKLASQQLGTVGAGNHFIDLFKDEQGYLWIGVHFGSRGFGHRTTMGFIALSQNKSFDDRVTEGSMDQPPILFDAYSEIGQDYWEAMKLAGDYAYAGRDIVVDKVLQILGTQSTFVVHNHHNFAWKETHFSEQFFVVRKGCTPAFPGQTGFVGSTMSDTSVIIEGVDGLKSAQSLYSSVHGAGRVMSRRMAAGQRRWKNGKIIQQKPGLINYSDVRIQMKNLGIELRGGGADEAPQCYKKLDEVLEFHKDTIKILHRLKPIGVAMAGEDIYDPYKD